jgi:CheY-like chemotaxis protein
MSQRPANCNQRILLVDDTPSIHQDFQKILGGSPDTQEALASAEAALFGDVAVQRQCFELDSAFQGQEALTRVTSALEQKRPYAMAFIDMRMPPGWDGLETIERLWQVDPQLQVALCTAHSDYSWEQMAERLELGDRLLILKKPFDSIEIRQWPFSHLSCELFWRPPNLRLHHIVRSRRFYPLKGAQSAGTSKG